MKGETISEALAMTTLEKLNWILTHVSELWKIDITYCSKCPKQYVARVYFSPDKWYKRAIAATLEETIGLLYETLQ